MLKLGKFSFAKIVTVLLAVMMLFCGIFLTQIGDKNGSVYADDFSEDGVVYVLTKRTSKTDADNGKTIMFVHDLIAEAYGYEDMPGNLLVPELPWGSAFLKMTRTGKAYITDPPVDTYVSVAQAAIGFDLCDTGTINGGWTEYSCSYSGVQHYKGGAYDYEQMIYYNSVKISLNKDNADWTNQDVDLYRNGVKCYDLTYTGTNQYAHDYVICGVYEIYVNGVKTGRTIEADEYKYEGGQIVKDSQHSGTYGQYFRSQFTYTDELNYYDFSVNIKLDDVPYNPSKITLYDDNSYIPMTINNGVATLVNHLDNNGRTYKIHIDGSYVGHDLKAGENMKLSDTIDYYTLKAELSTINVSGANVLYNNAAVSLRDENGNDITNLPYTGANGTTAIYSKMVQKDEKSFPTEYCIYVNNRNMEQSIFALSEKQKKSLNFYDVDVTLKENNAAKTNANVTLTNGKLSYLITTNSNGVYTERLYDDGSTYKISVSDVIDNGTDNRSVNASTRTQTLEYCTVNVKTYQKTGNATYGLVNANFRTYHVRKGHTISSIPSAYVDGVTFNFYSTSAWTFGVKESDSLKFNFATAINAQTTLYAHFMQAEVNINGYVRTDVNGGVNGQGMYLKTPNLTISGFDPGDNSIQSIMVTTTGMQGVKLVSLASKVFTKRALTAFQGNNVAIGTLNTATTITNDTFVLTFKSKVSMVEAQEYLRTQVIYWPKTNTALSIKVLVSDGVISASGSAAINAVQVADTWTEVKNVNVTNASTTFSTGNYYFSTNCSYNGGDAGTVRNGIVISGTVCFYIPTGITVTVKGSNGLYQEPGAAGILLTGTNKLYVYGEGTLNVTGGNAGDGSNGKAPGGTWQNHCGSGGDGGAGGGGAGAAIGSNGGRGGDGGKGGAAIDGSSSMHYGFDGNAGGKGGTGGNPSNSIGTYAKSGTVIAVLTPGAASTVGGNFEGWPAPCFCMNTNKKKWFHAWSDGGPGAGGGSGWGANAYGAGGPGGSGGGGGGGGGYYCGGSYLALFGAGGYAGAGNVKGTRPETGQYSVTSTTGYTYTSGKGGSGGSYYSPKAAKTAGTSNPTHTITFTNISTVNYYFNAYNLTFPEYTKTPAGSVFLGWQISTVGKDLYNTGNDTLAPFTNKNNKNLFQPGEVFTLSKYTYGNIVFKPVTMPVSGKMASDTLNVANNVFLSSGTQPKQTYYTYTLKLTLAGEPHDFGQIRIVNTANANEVYSLTSGSTVGTYTIMLTKNASFYIYVGNAQLVNAQLVNVAAKAPARMLLAAAPSAMTIAGNGTQSVNFSELKVNVNGITPQSVKLVGDNAPYLEETKNSDGTYTYTAYAQDGVDTNSYQIQVDDEQIPLETATASFGTSANVGYGTIKATIDTNTTINTVELLPLTDGSVLSLKKNGTTWDTTCLIDNTTTYKVIVNGVDTGVTTIINAQTVNVSARYYNIVVQTRIDGVVADVVDVKVNDQIINRSAVGTWNMTVVSSDPLSVTLNDIERATITPTNKLDTTYIDYYTITYTSSNSSGSVPVDKKLYAQGDKATLLDKADLEVENKYFAGWKINGADYATGDIFTITGTTVAEAIWKLDELQVQYIDAGVVYKTVSKLQNNEKLVAGETRYNYTDAEFNYTFKNWLCSVDGNYYEVNEVTEITAQDIMENDNIPYKDGAKYVSFTAVYEVEYKHGIHLEGNLDANEKAKEGVLVVDNDDEFIVQYKVTINDGVNSIVLIPEFDQTLFSIVEVTVGDTVLGAPTITSDYATRTDIPCKIALEGDTLYNTTGDILVSVKYKVINVLGGSYIFGFVTEYKETSDQVIPNDNRSHAYFWNSENPSHPTTNTEVQIVVDTSKVKVIFQVEGKITIDDQTFVYKASTFDTLPIEYTLATEFDTEKIYYIFAGGKYVPAEIQPTEANFGDNYYYTKTTSLEKVLFYHNGYSINETCVTKSTYTVRWYTLNEEVYTEIDAPKNVGTYYIGISATKNDYYTAVEEVKAKITITQMEVVITIDNKSSIWDKDLEEFTGEVTDGTIFECDDLEIVYSTTVTSTSNVGVYADAITGSWNNDPNYTLTFVNGDYTITIADNSFVVELETVNRDYNTVAIKNGTKEAVADFYAESKYGNENMTFKFYTFDGEIYTELASAPANAGTYYVKAFVAGDETKYNALESEYIEIVISKALVTIDDLTASSKVYNSNTQVWTVADITGVPGDALYTLNRIETFDSADYVNVGTPTIRVVAVLNDPDNYTFATEEYMEAEETKTRQVDYQDISAEITKFAIIVTPNAQTNLYNTQNQSPLNLYTIIVAEGEVPEFVANDETLFINVIKKVEAEEWINVGEYITSISYLTDNYEVTINDGTYTITKAYAYVPNLESFVYDKTEKTQANSENTLYTYTATETYAGTYSITLTLVDANNYMWVNVNENTSEINSNNEYYIRDVNGNMVKAYLISEFADNQVYYVYGEFYKYEIATSYTENTTYYTKNDDTYQETIGVTSADFVKYYIKVEDDYIEVNEYQEGTTYYTYDETNIQYVEATGVSSASFNKVTYYVKVKENYQQVETTAVENYQSASIELAWVISPAKVTVTIADKESVYGEDLETLTSDVTSGTVYAGDNLGITLTKATSGADEENQNGDGTNADEYVISGEWTNTNYDVTFVNGTYTIKVKTIAQDENSAKTAIINAITGAIKEYTGEELSWDVADFALGSILGQISTDTNAIFEISNPTKIDGQDYTNANGKVVDVAWTYYTDNRGNLIKKYTVTATIINYNYVFYTVESEISTEETLETEETPDTETNTNAGDIVETDVLTLTVEVEVFIKQATNSWTTAPSVQAETYSNIVKTSVAKFGDDSANNFVAFYSDETCSTEVAVANLEAGEKYYAKFVVAEDNNYTGLEEVVSFELGFNVNGELVVYFNGEVSDKTEEIIYNGLYNYFAKNSDGTTLYNLAGEGEGYTYAISTGNNSWKDVGTYTLTFKVKDNWVWSDKSDEDIVYTLTITKAPLKITVDNKEIQYLDTMPTYTVTTSESDFVNGETFETYNANITSYISCEYTVGSQVNTYTMTLADDANKTLAEALYNYDLTLVNGTLTVNKKVVGVDDDTFNINVTMEDVEVTYDAQSHSIAIVETDGIVATYTIDGAEGNSKVDVKRNGETVEAYTVVATLSLDGKDSYGNNFADNYELKASTISANLTINPKEITVTANDKTSVYSEEIKILTSTVSPAFDERDGITVAYSIHKDASVVTLSNTSDVGTYVIKATAQGTGIGNYTITYVDGDYTITIATNIWTFALSTVNRMYNGIVIAKGTSDSKVDYFSEAKFGDNTTVYTYYTKDGEAYTAISAPAQAGTYYVKATVAETNNYTGLESEYTQITISKKTIETTIENSEVTYDAQSHSIEIVATDGISATYTIDGLDGNEAIDVKRNGETVEAYIVVATLTLTGNDEFEYSYADNYELTEDSITANLTIKPLAVEVTADNKEVVYGDAPATLTNTATPTFYERDNVQVSYTVKNGDNKITLANDTNVGIYTIIPSATNIDNYAVTFENGTYTINKALIQDKDEDGTPDDANNDNPGLKISVSAEDVYYNRSLLNSSLVKIGTLELSQSAYEIKFYAGENEVTPVNAGVYTMKVVVNETENYDSAEKEVEFEILKIALKPTTFTYNKDTATWTVVTEDVGADGVTPKALKTGTVLAYTIGETDYTNAMSYKATATGTYTVKVTATNDENYLPSEATTDMVYSVDFAEGTHERQETKGVEGLDAYTTQYRFEGQKATRPTDPTIDGYTFKQWNETAYDFDTQIKANTVLTAIWDINTYTITWYNQGTEIYHETYNYKDTPEYKVETYNTPTKAKDAEYTYTHAGWNTISDTLETITLPEVTENATYYAIFSREANKYTITYYVSKDGGEYELCDTVSEVPFDSVIEIKELTQYTWFRTDVWFTDKSRATPAPVNMTAENLMLYGAYVFDIGLGDVDGNGKVEANDITLYRQNLVGGYDITIIEKGNEWATVTERYDNTKTYFLKRVADLNASTAQATVLGDRSYDIRDVSTIRMAMVGGYGFDVASGVDASTDSVVIVRPQLVSTVTQFANLIASGQKIKFANNIESLLGLTKENIVKNITVDLNGKTLTVQSMTLQLKDDFDGTIKITNGTIKVTNGITIKALNGYIILDNVTIYDASDNIVIKAKDEESLTKSGSVHFKVNDNLEATINKKER